MLTHDSSPLILNDCLVLGASGFPFGAGNNVSVAFSSNSVSCRSQDSLARFSLLELSDLSISGPGTVVTGGGFIGGGFGIDGALQGMAIAAALNAITIKKKIHTLVALTTNFGELHLHTSAMDPGPLRIYLSDVFVRLRRLDPHWTQARKQIIDAHLHVGAISPEDAQVLKDRLSSPPVWPSIEEQLEEQRKFANDGDAAPQGRCPSCERIIPLFSEECPFCNANFGKYASWSVIPI